MATVDAARRFFRGQDVVVEPRKLWVARLPDRKGKIGFHGAGPGARVRRRPGLEHRPGEPLAGRPAGAAG